MMRSNRGFSLIEVVIVLAVLGVLAGVLTPSVFQQMESARDQAAREEVSNMYRAIMGESEAGTYGYLGDVGSLPGVLDHLFTKPDTVYAYFTSTGGVPNKHGVGRGWRGPYLTTRHNDLLDSWGTLYRYGQAPDGAGQIRSAGRDKTFDTEDDIVFPLHAVVTQGTLLVTVFVNGVPNPKDTSVTVYSTVSGQQGSMGTKSTNDVGFNGFVFTVPQGIQVVEVTQISYVRASGGGTMPVSATKLVSAAVPARKQVYLEVFMANSEPAVP